MMLFANTHSLTPEPANDTAAARRFISSMNEVGTASVIRSVHIQLIVDTGFDELHRKEKPKATRFGNSIKKQSAKLRRCNRVVQLYN